MGQETVRPLSMRRRGQESMRFKTKIFCLALSMLVVVGCSKKPSYNKNDEISVKKEEAMEVTATRIPTSFPDSRHIVWNIGFVGGPGEKEQKRINELLAEKGYNCEIQFVVSEAFMPGTNREWIDEYEKNNEPFDILFTGSWSDIRSAFSFVKERFVPLTSYLNSPSGSALKSFFSQTEWAGTSYGGEVYAIPIMVDPTAGAAADYLYVPNRYAEYFAGFDGTYFSLRELYDKYHKQGEVILVQEPLSLMSFLGYQKYLGRVPYDDLHHKVVDCIADETVIEYVKWLWEDINAGILEKEEFSEKPDEQVFAYIRWGRQSREGYMEIPLKGYACDYVFNFTYGISQKSTNQELALEVLTACYTDPDISEIFFPLMNGSENMDKRRELLNGIPIGELQDFVPSLSEEQWSLLMSYPFPLLFDELFFYGFDEEIDRERYMPNEKYNPERIIEGVETDFSNLFEELNRQIEAYLIEGENP